MFEVKSNTGNRSCYRLAITIYFQTIVFPTSALICFNTLYMWCNLGNSVWSLTYDIFSFLLDWSAHLERYINFLLKTIPESDQWFQSYEQLKDCQNKRNSFLFLAISHNQRSRLPTDSARSQHRFRRLS